MADRRRSRRALPVPVSDCTSRSVLSFQRPAATAVAAIRIAPAQARSSGALGDYPIVGIWKSRLAVGVLPEDIVIQEVAHDSESGQREVGRLVEDGLEGGVVGVLRKRVRRPMAGWGRGRRSRQWQRSRRGMR